MERSEQEDIFVPTNFKTRQKREDKVLLEETRQKFPKFCKL